MPRRWCVRGALADDDSVLMVSRHGRRPVAARLPLAQIGCLNGQSIDRQFMLCRRQGREDDVALFHRYKDSRPIANGLASLTKRRGQASSV